MEGGHPIDMKTIINFLWSRDFLHANSYSFIILTFRFFCGLMMIPYGYGKIINYDKYAADFFGDPIGIGDIPSLWLTIFAQTICPVALLLGFQTRVASIILLFNMMVAVKFHFLDPFSVKVLPLLFLGLYLIQTLLGAGKYSLDYLMFNPNAKGLKKRELIGLLFFILANGMAWFIFGNYFTVLVSLLMILLMIILYLISYNLIIRNEL